MQGLVLLPLGRLDRPDSFVNRALAESSGFLRFRPGLFQYQILVGESPRKRWLTMTFSTRM